MSTSPDASRTVTPTLLAEKIDDLADLFKRRLLDDRDKQRMFDALYEQLQDTRRMAEGELILPLARRLLGVIDRLDKAVDNELAESIADELAELLATSGVEELNVADESFDAGTQEVGSVVRGDQTATVMVRAVLRRGWRYNGRVLRPTLVSVSEQLTDEWK